jgi:ribonucleoside-diphosphate reductase subunit M2
MDNRKLTKAEAKVRRQAETQIEPLLMAEQDRFNLYPIRHLGIYQCWQNALKHDWLVDKIMLATDIEQYNNVLTPGEKHLINTIFTFFQPADGLVGENHLTNLYKRIQVPEIRSYYATQIHMEAIHADAYGKVIAEIIPDSNERKKLLNLSDKPEIKAVLDWAEEWSKGYATLGETLFAFTIVEGLFFQAPFCGIFWFKKRGNLLPGIRFLNEEISVDENDHATFSPIVYKLVRNKLSPETALSIMMSGVKVMYDFADYALPNALPGLDAKGMKQYIEFTADYILRIFGYKSHFGTPNPYDWMDMLGLYSKENFFEKIVANYQSLPAFNPTDLEAFEVGEFDS